MQAFGDFLIGRPLIERGDCIVVEGFETVKEAQLREAIQLYTGGYAKRVYVILDRAADRRNRVLGLNPNPEKEISAFFEKSNIPARDIAVFIFSLSHPITRNKALALKKILVRDACKSVILISDSFHARRTAMVFHAIFDELGIRIYQAPAGSNSRWWADPNTAKVVIGEYIKLLYYLLFNLA